MGRKKKATKDELKHRLFTRVNEAKYQELMALKAQKPGKDISSLLRDILYNRKIRVYTRDRTLDDLMEELARLRTEIRHIGVNINQITRLFNTYPEEKQKEFYAKTAFEEHQALKPRIEQLLTIIGNLSKKWLRESIPGKTSGEP